MAVASKFLAVGSIVPWTEPGAGAVATQALANATYGRRGLRLLRDGLSAEPALERLLADDPEREQRQVGLAGLDGSSAAYTGPRCHPWAGHRVGEGFACQGNILAGREVVDSMVAAFLAASGTLQHRLLRSLEAGDSAGGDRRGRQSAALRVERSGGGYQGLSDVVADLRVDDAAEPVAELGRLLELNDLYFGRSPASDKFALRGEVMDELARLSVRAGKPLPGKADIGDPQVREVLEAFIGTENLEDRVDFERLTIDRPALEYLRKAFG